MIEQNSNRFANYLSWKSIVSFSALNYVQAGLSFLISIGIASYFGKEVFGYYSYGMIFMTTLISLGSFGTDKSLVRDLVQKVGSQEQFLMSNTFFKLILGGLLALGVITWAILMLDDVSKKYVVIAFCLASLAVLISPKQWYDYIGKIHLNAKLGVAERVFCLLGLMLIVFSNAIEPIFWIVLVFLVSKILLSIVEWSLVFSQIKIGIQNLTSGFNGIIKNNVWIWLAGIGNLLMIQYNQIILEGSFGLKELAAFGLAFQLIQLVVLLQGQILRLSTPEIANVTGKGDKKAISRELIRTSGYVLGATILLVIPSYLFAPYFVTGVVGKDFTDALPVFNIFLIWVLIYGVAAINNQFLISLHLQKPYFVITLVFGVFSIFLSYHFVSLYGAVGAALSLLIAHSCSIIAQMTLVWRHILGIDKTVITST